MLKKTFFVLGWLLMVVCLFNIGLKLFAPDEAVIRYAGSSRNINSSLSGVAVGLIFWGMAAILGKLDALLQQRSE